MCRAELCCLPNARCQYITGAAPSQIAFRGFLYVIGGALLLAASLFGLHRLAIYEGHALGVAMPLLTFRRAVLCASLLVPAPLPPPHLPPARLSTIEW